MESIRRQLVVPPYVSALHLALGISLLAAGIALVATSPKRPVAVAPDVAVNAASPEPVASKVTATASEASADPAPPPIFFVFRAGTETYMRLADAASAQPKHAAPRLVQDESAQVALAAIADADVPARHRAWLGKEVVVDGACRAKITGFAIASRLTGDPMYAGSAREAWNAASVMELGAPVIAARLDRSDRCIGTFARDAAAAPVAFPQIIKNAQLAQTARSALLASDAARAMQRDWDQAQRDRAERGVGDSWWEHAEITTKILRHPRTGETFVAVHAYRGGECGELTINVWGWYRAAADGSIAPIHVARFDEELNTIDRIVDVDNDGTFELIGRPWLGLDQVLAEADGSELDRAELRFYGCAC